MSFRSWHVWWLAEKILRYQTKWRDSFLQKGLECILTLIIFNLILIYSIKQADSAQSAKMPVMKRRIKIAEIVSADLKGDTFELKTANAKNK